MKNKLFAWIALATGVILLIPFLAMRFNWRLPDPGYSISDKANWDISDFIIAGILIFGTGSAYVLVARRIDKHRVVVGFVFAMALIWLWVELAVGLFTNWGS